MIDKELVTRKLVLIGQDLEELGALAGMAKDEYLANPVNEAAAERYLERMIGRMIDVNFHILVESGQAPPSDYYQSFTKLTELGVYETDFAQRIARSAGLRNRIAHEYDRIEAEIIHEAVKTAMEDIPHYIRAVRLYVS